MKKIMYVLFIAIALVGCGNQVQSDKDEPIVATYGGYELEQSEMIEATPEIDEIFIGKQDEMFTKIMNEIQNERWFESEKDSQNTFVSVGNFEVEGMSFDTCKVSLPNASLESSFISFACVNDGEEVAGDARGNQVTYMIGFNEMTPGMKEVFEGEA